MGDLDRHLQNLQVRKAPEPDGLTNEQLSPAGIARPPRAIQGHQRVLDAGHRAEEVAACTPCPHPEGRQEQATHRQLPPHRALQPSELAERMILETL